jgi:hypothetical protein
MSLEAKIEKLTEAVITLTAALGNQTAPVAATTKVTADEIVKDDVVTKFEEPKETAAEKKKREAKEKRDAARQAKIDAETAEVKKEEEAEVEAEVEAEAEVVVDLPTVRKVASHLIKSGKKPLWQEELAKTGASKLSEVEDLGALLTALEGIAGMTADEIPDA